MEILKGVADGRRPRFGLWAISALALCAVIAGDLECADAMVRRAASRSSLRRSMRWRAALPANFHGRRVWLVMKLDMHSMKSIDNSGQQIRPEGLDAAKSLVILRTACNVNLNKDYSQSAPSHINGCRSRVKKFCQDNGLGNISRTTYEAREMDLPWVFHRFQEAEISYPEIYLNCLLPDRTDKKTSTCLGGEEWGFNPSYHDGYLQRNLAIRRLQSTGDFSDPDAIALQYATQDGEEGVEIKWSNATMSCGDAGNVVSIAADGKSLPRLRAASGKQTSPLTGTCSLREGGTDATFSIKTPRGTLERKVKGETRFELVKPPILVPFVLPPQYFAGDSFLIYTVTEPHKLQRSSIALKPSNLSLKNSVLWQVVCRCGDSREKAKVCRDEHPFWESSAVRVYVTSDNKDFLRAFAYEVNLRDGHSKKHRFIVQEPQDTLPSRSGESKELSAPISHTLWESYSPLNWTIWTMKFHREGRESAPIKCASDVQLSADAQRWKFSYRKDLTVQSVEPDVALSKFRLFLHMLDPGFKIGTVLGEVTGIDKFILERSPENSRSVVTGNEPSVAVQKIIAQKMRKASPSSEGQEWDGLLLQSCSVSLDEWLANGLDKVEIDLQRVEARSTRMRSTRMPRQGQESAV